MNVLLISVAIFVAFLLGGIVADRLEKMARSSRNKLFQFLLIAGAGIVSIVASLIAGITFSGGWGDIWSIAKEVFHLLI